jgi:valyl-tRNA synthetase
MTKSESALKKAYNPSQVEDRWYDHWMKENYFHANPDSGKEPYTIVIPPPNVTGMLTLGHVLNNTSQDILIRKARMEGKEACWVPGMDHASIATENMVVNRLLEQGIRKADLSRDEFLEQAWKWKEKYGGIIINQLKRMGCSCDWERERFTMDEGYSRAVLESFVRLYDKGLIYRGTRLVNWCPVSQSAISDEEVIHREVNGKLWYFKYPVVGLPGKFVTVATTRPETMLGDTAVAIYPGDKRYRWLVGKKINLPLVGRILPVIEDKFVDPEFGTGCVKVTPAHDPNDFAMGEKHDLDFINIMNSDATLNENVPEKYSGLSREAARELVMRDMESLGYIEKIEDYTNKIGYSERGNVPIEYFLSKQWYLKMKELADPALAAVNNGRIHFHPEHWVKTYNHWMENIKDWCISRQLIWGHRIPVYTCQNKDCGEVMVQVEPPVKCSRCQSEEISPENDVLDTWFSSWLWPFAIQNWPEASRELEFFYPTRTLVTAPDIIFFWVARMVMSGYEFMDDLPFTDVYFTSILRDESGRKFSKSLGNSPDPLDLFKEYGTDAVRFGIMLMAPQGLDVLFANSRLDVGRNFMNKLWNAARFVDMNLQEQAGTPAFDPSVPDPDLDLPERWILSRMNQTIVNVNRQLDRFHFNEAAKVIYEFTWSDFCDWYIEIAKTRFRGTDEHRANQARSVAVHVLRTILALLHPYAPFISEELWSYFKRDNDKDLIVSAWPVVDKKWINSKSEENMIALMNVITAVRTVRSSLNVPPSKVADMVVRTARDSRDLLKGFVSIVSSLANIGKIAIGENLKKPPHAATAVVEDLEIFIPLEGLIDFELERARLDKRRHELEGLVNGAKAKLENDNFIDRAPDEVVARERQKLMDISSELEKLKSNLEMLL